MTADREFCERFHREAPIATTLYHPHIGQVYGRGEFDGRLWIAMEYLDGINAAQLIREQFPAGMPAGEALSIIAATAGALDYAHQRGMLHRNVAPANIFLTNPGNGEPRILLTDFGIARQLSTVRRLGRRNTDAGAYAYAAPEQLTGPPIDARADQYALAATAVHLLTGAQPRRGDRHPQLGHLDRVLSIALAENPAARFASCVQFANALSEQAGVLVGDRSPEAVFALDYPDEAAVESVAGAGQSQPNRLGSTARSLLAAVRRPLSGRRSGALSVVTVPMRASRRWPWIMLGSAAGAALTLLIGLLAVGTIYRSNHDARPGGHSRDDVKPGSHDDQQLAGGTGCHARRHLPGRRQPRPADLQRHPRPAAAERDHLVGISFVVHTGRMCCRRCLTRRQRPPHGERGKRRAHPYPGFS